MTGHCKLCGRPDPTLRRRLCHACYERGRRRGDVTTSMTDATPVREHAQRLLASGMGTRTIAAAARIDRSQVTNLLRVKPRKGYPQPGPPPLIQAKTARALLAIPVPIEPDLDAVAHRERIVAAQAGKPKPKLRKERQLRFPEWYGELRDLGYDDFEIMRRRNMTAEALMRQLNRYRMPVSAILNAEYQLQKSQRRGAA